jgi:hypothetical protein
MIVGETRRGVGKRPLREVVAFPAQQVERFSIDAPKMLGDVDWSDWPDKYEGGGLLFHGDNKEVLAHLLSNGFRGKVDLIYIDPPFDSGADYVRRVELRGAAGTARLDGEVRARSSIGRWNFCRIVIGPIGD